MNTVRKKLRSIPESIAKYISFLSPSAITALGLLFSLLTPVVAYITKNSMSAGVIASVAMLMDAFDGSVARLRGIASKRGAFIDSIADRFSDAAIVLALYFLGCDYLLIYLVAAFSMTISYIRARAESLGVRGLAEVGIMTREFRGIAIIAVYLVHYLIGVDYANYLLLILLAILGITIIQRSVYVSTLLKIESM
ncbi:MAG: CDP-alcohol phosphatidyltransferase family protein [Sulfolobales archaeon]|nr:CDP-alcohol phosphatidyltransferase family protein [Sulfolobales archaeon]MDW8083288.1 CDP-alcohol phosphatidyltransferase family protein [Sulfolobales archaeon]